MSINKYYRQYIEDINIGSLVSKNAWFNLSLKSTKLMTQLRHRFSNDDVDKNCEDAVDVLYLIFGRKHYIFGKFVILYIPAKSCQVIQQTFDFSNRTITFTHLKSKGVSFWFQRNEEEAYVELALSNGGKLKPWETPFVLEAVTEYDKSFRKEWQDGWLVYEGNEYGDTSTFYIIGCIED